MKSAVHSYTRASSVHTKHADAYYNAGNALGGMGDMKSAVHSYKRAT